jgi:hypothetical protein
MTRCCFDKRIWIGLGVLAAGLLIADPRLGWVALPVLAGLACPLSMLLAMRGMRRGTGVAAAGAGQAAAGAAAGGRAAEIARLRREIGLLKAQAGADQAAPARRSSAG